MFSIVQVGLTWLRDGKVGDEKVEENENTLKHFDRKLGTLGENIRTINFEVTLMRI